MSDEATIITPMQKLVMDQIAPLLEQAVGIAEQGGVPLFCMVQTTSVVPGQVELANVSAHVRGFTHPAPMRFLIDFYQSSKSDPTGSDWKPGQRSLADAFVQTGVLWATTRSGLLRRLAVTAALVLGQGLSELPEDLIERTGSALKGLVGPESTEGFYQAIEELKRTSKVVDSPFAVVEIPSGSAFVAPGRH